MPVIDETDPIEDGKVKRLVLCCGKVYYDLLEKRRGDEIDDVALVRLEQLYPFPYTEVQAAINRFSSAAQVVWCQEEPRNQGAWRANRHRIERCILPEQELEFAGRAPSASPAVGYADTHQAEQAMLVREALGIEPNKQGK